MLEWKAEARAATQIIEALQTQVVQLTSRVSTLEEERRRNEQLHQDQADRRRVQAETSENALREQFRGLSDRIEAQVDASVLKTNKMREQSEQALRDYATQLRAQADSSEGMLQKEIARLRLEAAKSLSATNPNSSRTLTLAELGPRVEGRAFPV